jgi:hypothetical protein
MPEEEKTEDKPNPNPNSIKVGDVVTTVLDPTFSMIVKSINGNIATCLWEDNKKVTHTKDYELALLVRKPKTDGPMDISIY